MPRARAKPWTWLSPTFSPARWWSWRRRSRRGSDRAGTLRWPACCARRQTRSSPPTARRASRSPSRPNVRAGCAWREAGVERRSRPLSLRLCPLISAAMYAQCPECLTFFHLKPSHLKAANGRVRCSRCRHVFNALDTLREELKPEEISAVHAARRREQPPREEYAGDLFDGL